MRMRTHSPCPLDVDRYISQCTEELPQEVVTAAWESSRAAEMQEVAWAAALVVHMEWLSVVLPIPCQLLTMMNWLRLSELIPPLDLSSNSRRPMGHWPMKLDKLLRGQPKR